MPWLRNEIPLLNTCTYANTAASGLLTRGLLEWRRAHDRAYFEGGSGMKMKSFELFPETKQNLSAFFNCPAGSIALTPNFSIGLNFLLEGLDPGKRVLLLRGDYPSLNWPFESRGFDTHYVACGRDLESDIRQAVSEKKIDILALSLVQWVNGLKIGPGFLNTLKHECPHLLILADGTQFCGAFGLDFAKSGIDVLGASGYKWMLGGFGNAFFLFGENAEGYFNPRATGYNAAGGDLEQQHHIGFPLHLEPGHLDSLNFGSLNYALGQLAAIGMEAIETHNRQLSARFREGLEDTGWLEPWVRERPDHGTFFSIRGDQALYEYLQKNQVVCARRGGGIRLGFHLYNEQDEVDYILELIHKAANELSPCE